jgi:phenylalanyl-tRNA synthetase beta chain
VFELDLDTVGAMASAVTLFAERTSFPEVREDLAVVVADDVSAAQVIHTIQRAGEPLLRSAHVFDVYRDAERLGAGRVSLAVRLTFSASDRTLTDDEVAAERGAIVEALAADVGGRVRDS